MTVSYCLGSAVLHRDHQATVILATREIMERMGNSVDAFGPDRESSAAVSGSLGMADDERAIVVAELQALAEMIGLDMPEVFFDLLDTYLEESASLVAIMTGDKWESDPASLLRAVHSLKSSSASVGALRLSGLCGRVENSLRGIGEPVDVSEQIVLIEREFRRVQVELEYEKTQLQNN
jgi:HPt (histidine-containing phosphotransfer) domain-containing protein